MNATAKRTKSGNHPAVQAYRDKLQSVSDAVTPELDKLNAELDEFLNEVRTPVPPAPEERH